VDSVAGFPRRRNSHSEVHVFSTRDETALDVLLKQYTLKPSVLFQQ